jgi:hypothetical protein
MNAVAKTIDSVGNQIMKAVLVELQVLSPRYSALDEGKQQEVIDRLADAIADSINHAVHVIAAKSYESLPVKLIKAQLKEGIQFQVNVTGTPANSGWVEQVGKEAMLVFCDPTGFTLGLDSFRAPAKQRDAFDPPPDLDDDEDEA